MENKGVVYVIISALMFGSYGIWSRLIGDSFGVFYQAWTRALLIAIVLLPIIVWKKQLVPIERKDWGWMILFLVFTACTQAPLFYAYNHMDIGSATLLFFVSTLLTMYLVGLLFLREKMTAVKIVSFLLAAAGMYVVFSFSLVIFSILAAGLAMFNGIASGGEIAFSKKLSGNYAPLYLCWLSWVIIALTHLPISLLLHETQYVPSFTLAWAYVLGYAIASILGFWMVIKGMQLMDASIGGLVGLLEIVFSILLGIFLFHEHLTARVLSGGILILVAAALPNIVELLKKS